MLILPQRCKTTVEADDRCNKALGKVGGWQAKRWKALDGDEASDSPMVVAQPSLRV